MRQQILSHFNESGAYTEESLQPFKERLDSLKQILKQDAVDGKHPEPIVRLMEKRLDGVGESGWTAWPSYEYADGAERQLNALFASLTVISIELVPIHTRLVQLRKQLAMLAGDEKLNKPEYKAVVEELRKIDASVPHGFCGRPGS